MEWLPRVVGPGSTYGPGSYFVVKGEQREPEEKHLIHKNEESGHFMISKYENNQNTDLPIGIQISEEDNIEREESEHENNTKQFRIVSEAETKRQLRLLKNKEAQKISRKKKNHYIRCLEDRVAQLENHNSALIEEIKALKERHQQHGELPLVVFVNPDQNNE